ncbi:MAG: T9SS type A sorting domain-containing protein [Bacteroidales bacterium]|nr:T9SS type A sorting domain-containing protein [Bacteroidales bacterium]
MKKFFTLLTVILMTAVAFGQINPKPIYRVANNGPIRSDYYGNTTNNYVTTYEEDEIAILRLNAFYTPVAGEQLTQITFFWVAEYTSQGQPVAADPDFDIIIYQGGNANWVQSVALNSEFETNGVSYTTDAANMGTQIATQHYTCTADGNQIVTLNTPITFTGNEGEIWIGLKANGHTCVGLSVPETTPLLDWSRYFNRGYSENLGSDYLECLVYYFDASTLPDPRLTGAQLNFGAYIDNGQAYQPKSDFYVEMYDPESTEQYPDPVTSIYVDSYTDSIYFYAGAFNNGLDSSWGYYYRSIYIDGTTPIYIEEEEALSDELDGVQSHYGWRFGPFTLFGVEDMEVEGISFPFDVCVTFRYESEANYNGIDPDLSNNVYCATYTNQEPGDEDGIAENTNTLTVSPNPASTVIRVDNAAGAQISIFNIAGQEVMAIEAANANETINVANLTEGVYVVRVVNGNEVATSKVSIVR